MEGVLRGKGSGLPLDASSMALEMQELIAFAVVLCRRHLTCWHG